MRQDDRLAVDFLVYLGGPTRCVGYLPVEGAMPAASRSARRGEDHRRTDQTDHSDDHEDDSDGGQSEPVTLRGHPPIHDCAYRD